MSKKIIVTHVIQQLSRGGGARATLYLAHYHQKLTGYEHQILSLLPPDPDAVNLARDYGISVKVASEHAIAFKYLEESDIVNVSWWNSVEMYRFLRNRLPACRLSGWFHVGGQAAPQVLTNGLVDFFDLSIACSPFTRGHPALCSLSQHEQSYRVAMVYGATDFNRIGAIEKSEHSGFNIGYIGTVDFIKMHPKYVQMSSQAAIPDAQFLLCGSGEAIPQIIHEARALGSEHKFKYLGYVEDMKGLLSILDAYGYPLREDTYAASEMNLQEVMFAGIPVVVFPSGGIKDLVIDQVTGFVVNTEEEYAYALEYLYRNPIERDKIGKNAKQYAEKFFGAENAARQLVPLFESLLKKPKSFRTWGQQRGDNHIRPDVTDLFVDSNDITQGASFFISTLGSYGNEFLLSAFGKTFEEKLEADRIISQSKTVLVQSGIRPYRDRFPNDWLLNYWTSLCDYISGQSQRALVEAFDSVNNGGDVRSQVLLLHLARNAQDSKLCDELSKIINQQCKAQEVSAYERFIKSISL
jgi:glycosyltransferase involved in cell wall biosynthesis